MANSIPIVGRVFDNWRSFGRYLEDLPWGTWRPRGIVMHHTGAPSLAQWQEWQARREPVTDTQWLKNLGVYYKSLAWNAGPHFFFTPKHFGVLSDPTKRGTHARSFNSTHWGVEVVGDFDTEKLDGEYFEWVIHGMGVLFDALGQKPEELLFHRDDPQTTKSCPGKTIQKNRIIFAIKERNQMENYGDHPEERIVEDQEKKKTPPSESLKDRRTTPEGFIEGLPKGETLNLRTEASAKSPVLSQVVEGTRVAIIGEASNGTTKWLKVWFRDYLKNPRTGWVSAFYVKRV